MTSIAYDFDGTLVDVKARQMGLLQYICNSFQVEIHQDQIWNRKRQGANNVSVLSDLDIDTKLIPKIDGIWRNEIESQFWLTLDQKIPHRVRELQEIKNLDCRTYLISARKQPFSLYQQIEMLNLTSDFDDIICVNPSSKVSDKAHFLKALGVDLFIGDTETDFESAQIANVEFCGVSTGQRNTEFLRLIGVKSIDCEVLNLISA